MDSLQNPFAPGAGTPPPELAGRDDILNAVLESCLRASLGLPSRPYLLLGLRGVGKTVLLNAIGEKAEAAHLIVSEIESPEGESLGNLLYPMMGKVLRRLSTAEKSKEIALKGLRALRNFAAALRLKYKDLEISISSDPGVADTGDIEYDLTDMFELIGQAAKKNKTAWILLIDEIQYLSEKDLAAIIASLHKISQKGLPVVLVGAGLPDVARQAAEAKTYAERLFLYPTIGALTREAVKEAVATPLAIRGASITEEAIDEIFRKTEGYPFFIQEWAYNAWNCAGETTLTLSVLKEAYDKTIQSLDSGFFRVRFDRLTHREIDFVKTLASLGQGPFAISDVVSTSGLTQSQISPIRSSLIKKGVVYAPRDGELAFTVPLFSDYVLRNHAKVAR